MLFICCFIVYQYGFSLPIVELREIDDWGLDHQSAPDVLEANRTYNEFTVFHLFGNFSVALALFPLESA